jgi:hypothetical protein
MRCQPAILGKNLQGLQGLQGLVFMQYYHLEAVTSTRPKLYLYAQTVFSIFAFILMASGWCRL